MQSIYIGGIAAEAHGYSHLVGKQAVLLKQNPLLQVSLVLYRGEEHWISVADTVAVGDHCVLSPLHFACLDMPFWTL